MLESMGQIAEPFLYSLEGAVVRGINFSHTHVERTSVYFISTHTYMHSICTSGMRGECYVVCTVIKIPYAQIRSC